MADLVQTPSSVAIGSGIFPLTVRGVAGEAGILAGMPVYQKAADQKWYMALAGGSQQQSGQYGCGIAVDSAPGAGQYFTILQSGEINLGATVTAGVVYVVSANAGKIAPYTDLASGNWVTILGAAISASLVDMPRGGPFVANVQH